MKSQTIKLLWMLISITLFVIAITGTLLLVLTNASSISSIKIDKNSTLTKVDTPTTPSLVVEPQETTENQVAVNPLNSSEATNLNLHVESDASDIQIPLGENQVQSIYNQSSQTPCDKTEMENKIVSEEKRTVATIVEKKQAPSTAVATNNSSVKNSMPTTAKQVASIQPVTKNKTNVAKASTTSTPKKAAIVTTKKEKSVTKYWVQVASYTIISSAQQAKEDLKKEGIETIITTKLLDGKTHYRLRIGAFDSKEEADKFLPTVQSIKGYEKAYVSKTISYPL